MKTMKTLLLAAATVLSAGAGAAMAQEAGSVIDYWAESNVTAAKSGAVTSAASPTGAGIGTFRSQASPAREDVNVIVGGEGSGG
jgi:hypothetical protein